MSKKKIISGVIYEDEQIQRIIALFTNEDRAEEVANKINQILQTQYVRVDEILLNPPDQEIFITCARISKKGEIKETWTEVNGISYYDRFNIYDAFGNLICCYKGDKEVALETMKNKVKEITEKGAWGDFNLTNKIVKDDKDGNTKVSNKMGKRPKS